MGVIKCNRIRRYISYPERPDGTYRILWDQTVHIVSYGTRRYISYPEGPDGICCEDSVTDILRFFFMF